MYVQAQMTCKEEDEEITSFIQPAMAYENGSVFMSGPSQQWPISMNKQIDGPCATSDNAWHNEHHQNARLSKPQLAGPGRAPKRFQILKSVQTALKIFRNS